MRMRTRMRARGKIYKFQVVEENAREKWSQLAATSAPPAKSLPAHNPVVNMTMMITITRWSMIFTMVEMMRTAQRSCANMLITRMKI